MARHSRTPKQWEVWFAKLRDGIKGEQTYDHNVVVLSSDFVNASGIAIVAPITTTGSGHPWVVKVDPQDAGIDRESWIECHQLQALSTSPTRFLEFRRRLVPEKCAAVAIAVSQALRGLFFND